MMADKFPAQFARASLKDRSSAMDVSSCFVISRAICAGLIEGRLVCRCRLLDFGNFPRNLRGPH